MDVNRALIFERKLSPIFLLVLKNKMRISKKYINKANRIVKTRKNITTTIYANIYMNEMNPNILKTYLDATQIFFIKK